MWLHQLRISTSTEAPIKFLEFCSAAVKRVNIKLISALLRRLVINCKWNCYLLAERRQETCHQTALSATVESCREHRQRNVRCWEFPPRSRGTGDNCEVTANHHSLGIHSRDVARGCLDLGPRTRTVGLATYGQHTTLAEIKIGRILT